MYGIPFTIMSRTTDWEEGRRMVMQSIKPARPIVATATHLFERDPAGTRYTWSMEFVPNAPGGSLFAAVMAWVMRRNAGRQQQRFKEVMEREIDEPAR
jgi:hypothetical protein